MPEATMTMHVKQKLHMSFEHPEMLSGVQLSPLLEAAAGGPLQMNILSQQLHPLEVALPELVLDQGDAVLERSVLLRARQNRFDYLYSEALIVPDVLPLTISIRLLQREELLETIMHECRLPLFQEVIAHGRVQLFEIVEQSVLDHLETGPETDVFYRTSLLYVTQRPHCAVMRLSEVMPVAYLEESGDGFAPKSLLVRTDLLI